MFPKATYRTGPSGGEPMESTRTAGEAQADFSLFISLPVEPDANTERNFNA